ncbi:hypothetical protein FNH22_04445 [Fulvivirga sp. M361]|uniref:hypothetical protein n=1 Tax=Fulvivirga sp. M361 TaxID=2594266 RepID=UPI001179AC87|nr:hypothetical protein [Fulvivirga sp. M361]TRX61310.1 hypothetical protein FNH22_04445 [Fulvivirga sp. M361]
MFLIIVVILLLASVFIHPDFLIILFTIQAVLGATQYLNGWFIQRRQPDTALLLYLKLATVYIVLAVALGVSGISLANKAGATWFLIVPWFIAAFYWYISYKLSIKHR